MAAGSKPAPGPLSEAIAEILRGQQARKKTTAQAISKAVGMSPAQLSGVLNGQKHVDVEQLDRICFALSLDMEAVLREADEMSAGRFSEPGWSTPRL